MRASVPLAVSVAVYGVVFGILADEHHLSFSQTLGMSLFVFAGTAQFAALAIWFNPLPLTLLFIQTLVINSRHLMMGLALRKWFLGQSIWAKYVSAFFMIDESWALSLPRFEELDENPGFLLGSGLAMYLSWNLATILGFCVADRFGGKLNPEVWGLDVALPCVLVVLLIPRWKGLSSVSVWIVAAAASAMSERWLPVRLFPSGSNILIGAVAGSCIGLSRLGGKP